MTFAKRKSIFTILLSVIAMLFSGVLALESASAASVTDFKVGQEKAKKLYQKFLKYPNSSLAKRCCNFTLLEEKCKL